MPIIGKFYTSEELQKLLGVTKQRISNLAGAQSWASPHPGIYYAQSVEPYLMGRGIDPITLPAISWEWPEGITWAEENRLYNETMAAQDNE